MAAELVTVDQAARLTHRSTEAMRKLVQRHRVPVVYAPDVGTGTGWVVDRGNRLLVTNHHVVEHQVSVLVLFPLFRDGKLIVEIVTKSGAHNTVVSLDGSKMYLGGLKSPFLFVADTRTNRIQKRTSPFGGAIRPFTVNGAQTRAYVCVNDLLGFEIGDLTTDKVIHRVEIAGVKKGPVKRHGCPSHGIGLTPDEREVWVVDAFNQMVHVFDNTVSPPKQGESIRLREQPGWVTFSLDGKFAYPSTGEVIDTATKKIVAALTDEKGREVHSEKMVEIHFKGGKPVASGDQFGVGRAVSN